MKHLGAVLAVLAAATITFLLYSGVSWTVVLFLAALIYVVLFTLAYLKRVKKKKKQAPDLSDTGALMPERSSLPEWPSVEDKGNAS